MVSVSILLNLTILVCMYPLGDRVVLDVVNTSFKNCTLVFPLWLTGCAALNDLLHQSFLIYLFVKPLILIQKRRQHNSRQNAQANFRKLCLKYYVLGLFASISTTMFLLSVPMTGSAMWGSIDCTINSCCLLFCFSHWNREYKFFCQPFIGLVEGVCFRRNDTETKLDEHGNQHIGDVETSAAEETATTI